MTKEEFQNLQPGDLVRGTKYGLTYIVTQNHGDRITAVRSVDTSNPSDWEVANLPQNTLPEPEVMTWTPSKQKD
jgi:hypothetical protein